MKKIIESIAAKHKSNGIDINPPATPADIALFEQRIGFTLPADFVAFYTICNGFGCNEDIFNMIPLAEITQYPDNYGSHWFCFAEYMIYADTWDLRLTADGKYEIFNGYYPALTMTSSLEEFLSRYLKGNVFDQDGLYDWYNKLKTG